MSARGLTVFVRCDALVDEPADLAAHGAVLAGCDLSQPVMLLSPDADRRDDGARLRDVFFGHDERLQNLDNGCQGDVASRHAILDLPLLPRPELREPDRLPALPAREARRMTGWLLILAALLFWLTLSTLIGMVLGRVLKTRRREDSRPGYITDWTT